MSKLLAATLLAVWSALTQGTVLWTDDIQSGSEPWGFSAIQTQKPHGTHVRPSDATGANVTVVTDPCGGTGTKAIRLYNDGEARAQVLIWSVDNAAFDKQAKSAAGVWIEHERCFPSAMSHLAGDAWLSLLDFHSVDRNSIDNRWHANPGLFLCTLEGGCSGNNMRLYARNFGSKVLFGPTRDNLAANTWHKIQVHYKWSTSPTPITFWVNGVRVMQEKMVTKGLASHANIEFYIKWYGSYDWSPNPRISYVRNVRFADAFIESTPVRR